MKKLLQIITILCLTVIVKGQCPTDLLSGQNLVTNGDFSQGYTGWTFTPDTDGNPNPPDGYIIFNPPATQNYSQPGFIYVGSDGSFFNSAFANTSDHAPTADNMMLMVDGVCSNGIKLWSQSGIPIRANTNYYFSVWVRALKDGNNPPGTLQFDINNVNLPMTITAPTTLAAGWIQYEAVWNSGIAPPPTITISIENTTTTGCDQYVDFAIDDITFIPGCSYGAAGPQPNLGPDQTLCGRGGTPITLNAGVPMNATTTVTWSTGATGTGLGAPYSINVNAPGTYSVCVSDNGSCTKSDVIVITNNFSIDLGPDLNLCNPAAATLNAGFTGTGVTYQWYRNFPTLAAAPSTNQTYFVNTPGTYRVQVTDPICGMRWDEVVISSTAAVPTNATYCTNGSTVNLSVAGSGTYRWFDTQPKGTGTILANGSTYATPSLVAPNNYVYYVEDISSTAGSVGPTTVMSNLSNWGSNTSNQLHLNINITQDLQITQLKIPFVTYGAAPAATVTIEVRDASGNSFVPARLFTSDPTNVPNGLNGQLVTFNFTGFNLQTAWGNNLRLAFSGKGGGLNGDPFWNQGSFPAYTYNSTPAGIMSITGSGGPNGTNGDYVYFYDIRFQTGVPCERVPVTVTYSCPMPVKLTSFIATLQGANTLLKWTTSEEINSFKYIIQRSSDGLNFTSIGEVAAAGNSNSILNYSYVDYSPMQGNNYYRLVQYDIDGSFQISEIVVINAIGKTVLVSPNPANDMVTISFENAGENFVRGLLYNSLGELILQKEFEPSAYISETINISHLASGVYFMKLSGAVAFETIKIVKE